MKAITLENGKEVTLTHVTQASSGYGHKEITCYFMYNGEEVNVSAITDNMPDFDDAMDIEDYNERATALFELVEYRVINILEDFFSEIKEEQVK